MLDMRAERLQLFDKLLVAALDVMDSRNLGRPVGDQARYDEGRSATQIGRGNLCTRETLDAMNHGMMALDTNVGTHAHQLRGKHKAILEDVLGNNGTAVGESGEHHNLRLHVRREAGERKRLDVDRLDTLGTVHMDAILDALAVDTHELHLLEHHAQVNGTKARDIDTTIVGHQRTGNDKGTGLDAVAHYAMGNRMQFFHALDGHDRRTGRQQSWRPSR